MTAAKICGLSLALLASCLLFSSKPAVGALIESEPNNTLATADAITRTTPTFADAGAASLSASGDDVDVFSINLLAGDFLQANTAGTAGPSPGASPDTVLGLFDAAGALLELNDDGFILGSNFTYLIPSDGDYFIAVTGYADGVSGLPGDSFGDPGVFDGTSGSGFAHGETGSYILTVSVIPTAVPEPSSCLLAVVGSLFARGGRRRRN